MSRQIDTITATLLEKEIISVKFTVVDILNYVEKEIVRGLIQEVPTKLSSIRFQTTKPYVSGSIKFFLNGLKEQKSDITEISTTIFEIVEAILITDDFEVEYTELL